MTTMSITDLHATPSASTADPEVRVSGARGLDKRVQSSYAGPDSAAVMVNGLFAAYQPLAYQLPWQTLDYVELLATWNPDYSQAVENIKMLANSGHTLFVESRSKLRQRRIKKVLEDASRLLQEQHGGIDGIIDKLLDQAATFGAMCGEVVLSEDLRAVVDFADINPKKIRFFWDSDFNRYRPFQKVTAWQFEQARKAGQLTQNGCIALNEETFHYYAFDAAPSSPYGTPPFLASLANIAMQRDIMANMAQIVKKIGLLGIVDLSIKSLSLKPGETDDAFRARATAYLDAYVKAAEDMAREGGLVHFDDVTASTYSIAGNAAGATNIHKANEEMIFSGLKSMPSVQGRSYSTTETYAGVAYDIIIRNTEKYQRACKRMIEAIYWKILVLSGEPLPDGLRIEFHENRSLNRLQEANSVKIEIQNAFFKWILGVIDQTGVANELGYAEPKIPLAEAPAVLTGSLTAHDVGDPTVSTVPTAPTAKMEDDDESDLEG